ncbi:SDR family NAD(P)-dependent oxidoreductase [Agromyces seonyuensis]|uniref:SDR family NAD(P)-dependent oxidoreductase n=1 Tax=Agromyces seonyuensis TaxID=2662446 RepID=A0A6I4NRK6_9MICO|nr:SDR family NAD(P)-dependent oxidoreductase [Agromyces seonyuensis]MWB97098.1 SDR family NAD(P)-dependent oxidoreductase [Agromyces seonyuensis]
MDRRTIIITGASDGIGAAASRALAARGERLLLVGRSPEKLAAVAEPLGAERFAADFARLDEVRALAQWVQERTDRIDVLANNAGGVFAERVVTVDGNERTMQVNHDAAFLLTHLLLDTLVTSGAKVVNTSSAAAGKFGELDLDDLEHDGKYAAMRAYGDSKLANILFTAGLDARYRSRGLSAVAFHPGDIASNFAKDTGGGLVRFFYASPLAAFLQSPEAGAHRLLWAVDGTPGADWQSGAYYSAPGRLPRRPHPQQDDTALMDAFWVESARRVGVGG